jgi:hypothetical protein
VAVVAVHAPVVEAAKVQAVSSVAVSPTAVPASATVVLSGAANLPTAVLSGAPTLPPVVEAPNLPAVPVAVGWTWQPPPCRLATCLVGTPRTAVRYACLAQRERLQAAYVTRWAIYGGLHGLVESSSLPVAQRGAEQYLSVTCGMLYRQT